MIYNSCFFCVGAPKCGTTTLYFSLLPHPGLLLSNFKEPQFFTKHFDRGDDWYLDTYFPRLRRFRQDLIIGEFSPDYLSDPKVPKRIRQTCSGSVKIIVITRDPIARTLSHYVHARRQEQERRSVDLALTSEIAEIKLRGDGTMPSTKYVWDSLYGLHISRYCNAFGFENVLNLSLEHDLIARPTDTLNGLQVFLGIDEAIHGISSVRNVSKTPPRLLRPVKRALYRDNRMKQFFRRVLPVRMQQRVQNAVDRLIDFTGPRSQVPELRRRTTRQLDAIYGSDRAQHELALASALSLDDVLSELA